MRTAYATAMLPDTLLAAVPAAERLLRLLAPWDRARLRATSRVLAGVVPRALCAPCLSAMLRHGGPALFRHDARPPAGVALCADHLYDAVAADNPHAVRWLRASAAIPDAPSAGEIVDVAARWDSRAVLCALLDEEPRLCTDKVLRTALRAMREHVATELLGRLLRRPHGDERLGDITIEAVFYGLASVVEDAVRAHSAAAPRQGQSGAAATTAAARVGWVDGDDPSAHPMDRIKQAIRAGNLPLAESVASAMSAKLPRVFAHALVQMATDAPRAYDALRWAHAFLAARGVGPHTLAISYVPPTLYGPEPGARDPTWNETLADVAVGNRNDPTAGAVRWLEEHAGVVPDIAHLESASKHRSVHAVRHLVGRLRPQLAVLVKMLAECLLRNFWRMADLMAAAVAVASGHHADRTDDAFAWLLLHVLSADDRCRAYAAALLRRHGLLRSLGGAFLREVDRCTPSARHLGALAAAGCRLDADRAAWLDWLWPERARPGHAVPTVDLLYAYRLHARYARARSLRPSSSVVERMSWVLY